MTKTDRLLERIREGYKPKAGDVLVKPGYPGKFVVTDIGKPFGANSSVYVSLTRIDGRDPAEWHGYLYSVDAFPIIGAESGSFKLVDVGFDEFIFVGYSPTPSSGRTYVIFKLPAGVVLRAGCRSFTTYAQAAKHWRQGGPAGYPASKRALAKKAFDLARKRGWLKVSRAAPVKKARAKKKARRR